MTTLMATRPIHPIALEDRLLQSSQQRYEGMRLDETPSIPVPNAYTDRHGNIAYFKALSVEAATQLAQYGVGALSLEVLGPKEFMRTRILNGDYKRETAEMRGRLENGLQPLSVIIAFPSVKYFLDWTESMGDDKSHRMLSNDNFSLAEATPYVIAFTDTASVSIQAALTENGHGPFVQFSSHPIRGLDPKYLATVTDEQTRNFHLLGGEQRANETLARYFHPRA